MDSNGAQLVQQMLRGWLCCCGAAAEHALQLLLERVSPLRSSETSRPVAPGPGGAAGAIPVIFRIALGEKTGRYERD
jgi:hypothetical protein